MYQVSVGNPPPPYCATCNASVKRYCEKFDIDHIVQRDPILKIKPLNNQRQGRAAMTKDYLPIYEKENAFALLGEYDKVCIVDSDIYIRDNAPNIFDQIDLDTPFAGVRECDAPITPEYRNKLLKFSKGQYETFPEIMKEYDKSHGVPFYNMGLMLFTTKLLEHLNGDTPEQFIRRKEFEPFVNGEGHWQWSQDQTLLNYWIKTEGIVTKNLDWRWNTMFKAARDDMLHEAYFIHFVLSSKLPRGGAEISEIVKDLSKARGIRKLG